MTFGRLDLLGIRQLICKMELTLPTSQGKGPNDPVPLPCSGQCLWAFRELKFPLGVFMVRLIVLRPAWSLRTCAKPRCVCQFKIHPWPAIGGINLKLVRILKSSARGKLGNFAQ